MIRVVLADDHAVVRRGLAGLLESTDDIEVVGVAKDGSEAVDLVREHRPDVAVMDLQMPVLDGVEATRAIVEARTGTEVLVLTSFSDHARIDAAIEAGAVGYLLKDAEPEVLLDGIRAVARGESPLDPRAARRLLSRASRADDQPTLDASGLSPREVQVAAPGGGGAAQQADRLPAGHHRAHGEGAPHLRLPAHRCRRPHPGRAVGAAARSRRGLSPAQPSPAMR